MGEQEARKILGVNNITRYFGRLFEIRDSLHLQHLRQKSLSFATHEALDVTYKEILPIIDNIIEGYSGLYFIPDIRLNSVTIVDSLTFAKVSYKYITEGRNLFVDSWIHSEIDNLSKIFAILIYKLKYVK